MSMRCWGTLVSKPIPVLGNPSIIISVLGILLLILAGVDSTLAASARDRLSAPTEMAGLVYDRPFFPGAHYDPAVPTVEDILGFALGDRFTSAAEIEACLMAWDEVSPRTQLVEYARTYEGRPLYYLVVSTPANLARLEEIKAGMARLADPRGLADAEAQRLLASLPAVGWFSYCIHGNETSGSDAALAVCYHLTAAVDREVTKMLDDLVVIIDPLMNPDGHERFFKQTQENRGRAPNVDDQSLLHRGYWPSGRMNHYLFDLNRDWIFCAHPETRGRVREIGQWRPLLVVDGHEMGPLNTYLFSPPRDPVNPNYPRRRWHWAGVFAADQAAAFDANGWLYYTGEWADDWYAGYSSWAAFRGSVHILYEQARVAENAVRRPEGTLLTYREAVHHQITSSMANLRTLHAHAGELLAEFLAERQRAVGGDGPYAGRTFAIPPQDNGVRLRKFLDLMMLQGIEVYTMDKGFTAREAVDQLGRTRRDLALPAGTLLVPNRQPEAPLVAAMLEFDPHMSQETLQREREELLRGNESRMYDVTAWNITMLYGLRAFTLPMELPQSARLCAAPPAAPILPLPSAESIVAFAFDGKDDRSLAAAARLLERGAQVRVADRDFTLAGHDCARGTALVTRIDNTRPGLDLAGLVGEVARNIDLAPLPIVSGLGEGDLPDLGGEHFRLLAAPRVALLARGGISAYDYGAIWYMLDQELGIRHSHLDEQRLTGMDLRRYNVLVLPDRFYGELPAEALKAIRTWVETGGTLIAIGSSAESIAKDEPQISQVRLLPDVLDRLDLYELQVLREWQVATGQAPPPSAVWSHTASPQLNWPWPEETKKDNGPGKPKPEELRKRDDWLKIFMPQGAFLATRADPKHWLTFGCIDGTPLLVGSAVGNTAVLMAAAGVEAPIRLGLFTPVAATDTRATGKAASKTEQDRPPRIGWAPLPDGYELRLRMSGLLWPEAVHRLANAAYVTREKVGRGQVILFAAPPAFRGAALGARRILLNAIVYGPGLGASQPVEP
jgi:hypothetical protein